ncbi:MAG: mismatch repair protein MutS [Ignavibacteria bacterium]|nr:mismatch repair protein MutS [Ignavibacteria bacterium]
MKDKQTPLLKQYNQIKEKYPETILLYRLGDFYETFGDDAITTSKVCGIVLTKRNHGAAGDLPLAGFPYHQLDAYLPKLVRAGHRVAVCEQLEDPKFARGIVKRDVVEVVTPGVSLYDKLLDTKKNNYVASVVLEKGSAGLAACDISTGEFLTCEIPAVSVGEVLESLCPAELVISKTQKDEINTLILGLSSNPAITKLEEWIFGESFGREVLLRHFKTQNLKGFGIDGLNLAIAAAGAILHYILETQKSQVQQISRLTLYNPSEYMPLDYATRRNLEILYSFSDNTAQSSLISILDKTSTAMGGRLLKKWITRPLLNLDKIQSRLDAVEAILNNNGKREVLRKILSDISDLERLISKVCTGRANPREVVVLKQSLLQIPKIKEILREINHPSLTSLASKLNPLVIIIDLIETALVEEPSVQLGAGSVFRPKYDAELDSYVEAKYSGKSWISNYQEDERRKTGITSLKVGFTSVFGYYIEVTNLHSSKVPDEYQRKQTLTNAERYTTKELKEYESKILGAEEKINELEQRLFAELRSKIALQTEAIQEDAYLISSLDCLTAFAQASHEYSYCKPVIDNSTVIEIHDGRHPVVERLLGIEKKFTPNSTLMDSNSGQVHIITGPNMSCKSCYLNHATCAKPH